MIGEIESGNITIKILANNATSITLQTDKKFNGKVIQPQFDSVKTVAEHGLGMSISIFDNDKSHLFLFDTGSINQSIIGNIKALNVKYCIRAKVANASNSRKRLLSAQMARRELSRTNSERFFFQNRLK